MNKMLPRCHGIVPNFSNGSEIRLQVPTQTDANPIVLSRYYYVMHSVIPEEFQFASRDMDRLVWVFFLVPYRPVLQFESHLRVLKVRNQVHAIFVAVTVKAKSTLPHVFYDYLSTSWVGGIMPLLVELFGSHINKYCGVNIL